MRRVILTPVGSAGDVNPFLWIGSLLKSQGHPVAMITNPIYEEAVRHRGIDFHPIGDLAEYESIVANKTLWHPTQGPRFVMRLGAESTSRLFECVTAVAGKSADPPLLLGSCLAFGTRLAHERYGFPHATVHLQPISCLSAYSLPLPGPEWNFLQRLPLWMRRTLLGLIRKSLDGALQPGIRRACKWASVPPPLNVLRDWWHGAEATICLFPEWFAPPQPDWPDTMVCAGFPLFDRADQSALPEKLEAFLAAGPPPVVFTFGSAMAHCRESFAEAARAADSLGFRAIFATDFVDQFPKDLPRTICTVSYVPFSLLLPRCAAIVHHGGIGTLSQAMAAGVPQLIVALSHDQPDNAGRAMRLGIARYLRHRDFSATAVASQLKTILSDAAMHDACRRISDRMREGDTAARLLEILRPLLHAPQSIRTRRIALIRAPNTRD